MKILIGIFALGLIWVAYQMVNAPFMDDNGHEIDPDNKHDNLW